MPSKEFIEVEENVYLHVRDWGQGKTIVFIPGWPLGHEMFEYQFNQLPKENYRCVSITMRGFGKSSKPWGDYNYDVFTDDIKKVLETLDLKDITLAGFSMGGAIALRYMTRHNGARISRLALLGAAAPSFTKRAGFQFGHEREAVDKLIKSCYEDRAKLNLEFGKIFFRSEESASPKLKDWFQNMGMEASSHATAAGLIALRDTDLHEEMRNIKVPTIILHGKQDKICFFELAQAMSQGIKGSELIKFENSGHALFFDEKEKFNSELKRFVQ